MLVHCSAGIGRSGAFILIHSVLEKLAAEGKSENDMNIHVILDSMRRQREGLIPHKEQYDFCHDAIEYSLRMRRVSAELGISASERSVKFKYGLQKSLLNRSSHLIPHGNGEDY